MSECTVEREERNASLAAGTDSAPDPPPLSAWAWVKLWLKRIWTGVDVATKLLGVIAFCLALLSFSDAREARRILEAAERSASAAEESATAAVELAEESIATLSENLALTRGAATDVQKAIEVASDARSILAEETSISQQERLERQATRLQPRVRIALGDALTRGSLYDKPFYTLNVGEINVCIYDIECTLTNGLFSDKEIVQELRRGITNGNLPEAPLNPGDASTHYCPSPIMFTTPLLSGNYAVKVTYSACGEPDIEEKTARWDVVRAMSGELVWHPKSATDPVHDIGFRIARPHNRQSVIEGYSEYPIEELDQSP